ncbi:MAG: RNA polymerase sigma factor [Pyrinomonadaceae bacterium]
MLNEVLNTSLRANVEILPVEFADSVELSDEILVEAALRGDEPAFAEIFDRYKRPITGTVGRFFRERSDIEEFVQQSFTKAYFSLKRYRGGKDRSFGAWLTRIAINVCYDEFRRRKRRGENHLIEIDNDEKKFLETVADQRICSAEDSIVAAQLAEKFLSGLDRSDRVAMIMVYSEEYSLDETASALGISTSSLKSRLFRSRNHIKRRFGHLFSA